MRYDLFQKVRKRQKEALVTKTGDSKLEESPQSELSEPDNKENDLEGEGEMREPVERQYQTRMARLERCYSREIPRKKVEEKRKLSDEDPSDLVDTIRTQAKPNRKGFLPIAMPLSRPDPPQEDDVDYEYRSEFDAPDHIEVMQAESYEDARTDVSEITGLTYGMTRPTAPAVNGFHYPSRPQERFVPHVEQLEEVTEVSEEQGSRYTRSTRRIEVDVTDLDNIHTTARRARRELKHQAPRLETRYGLPYESTDFRADDDGSEDSWGVAIVGNHSAMRSIERQPSSPHAPIDVEKLLSETVAVPTCNITDVEEIRERLSKTEMELLTPRSHASSMNGLIKETLSAEGEVIIDLSQIVDDEGFHAVELLRKSPKQHVVTPQVEPEKYPLLQPVSKSPVSARSPRPQKVRQPTKPEPEALNSKQPTLPLHKAADLKQPQSPVQASAKSVQTQHATPVQSSVTSIQTPNEMHSVPPTNELITASMNYFKSLADGITSQLEKFDLLPENEMKSMLGILDKDLKATSKNVPEGKEVVNYLGEQIKNNSCVTDNTVDFTSQKELNLNFNSPSLDEMVDAVKTTYEKNLSNCGVNGLNDKPARAPTPQTFIVPITLRGYDFDSDQTDHYSPSEDND